MSITERENTVVSAPAERVLSDREQRARTLEAAALEIEVRGWAQGEAESSCGKVCIGGAIECALGHEDGPRQNVNWARVWPIWGSHESLWAFNDFSDSAARVTFVMRWRAEEIRDGR